MHVFLSYSDNGPPPIRLRIVVSSTSPTSVGPYQVELRLDPTLHNADLTEMPHKQATPGRKIERAMVLNLVTKSSKVTNVCAEDLSAYIPESPRSRKDKSHHLQDCLAGTIDHETKVVLSFAIPEPWTGKQPDCWDLWRKQDDMKQVKIIKPSEDLYGWDYIGRLDLQKLGYFDQRRRRKGTLKQVYICR